jgi:hypothetical protein
MTDNQNNSGNYNSGDGNSGYCSSGYYNSGYYNLGDCNSGYYNSGDFNSGNFNSGNFNSGYYNSGNFNSGYWNSGHRNSGYWNKCDKETGFFNSVEPETIRVFNKPCNIDTWNNTEKPNFIYFNLTKWIDKEDMTNEEKEQNPNYKTTNGYLKTYTYQEAWANAWANATDKDKKLLYALPNFDAEVFKEISGIDVNISNKKTVTLELTDEQLKKIKTILDN